MSRPNTQPESRLARTVRMATSRPHLAGGVLVALGLWLALGLAPELRWSTRSILTWNGGCVVFIGTMLAHMANRTPDQIRATSALQDEGQGFIIALVLVACVTSLASVAAEMDLAKGEVGLEKALRIGLATLTVLSSWFMVQLIFALHYAHEYYGLEAEGGLQFPGGEDPDYWDFVHFSVVLGAAAQTADVAFTSKPMRRIGTVHTLFAFLFNTVVLALSINLLASLV